MDTRASTTDMDMPTTLPAPGYDIGDLIGQGGMGEVLAAQDKRIGREVALKRMKLEATSEALSRFLREARIQARLDHPSIVPVYALDTDDDGRPYFTMKRVTGRTLQHRLADGGALNRILRAFVDVCQAIEYAHLRGVIHRDLKPSNIMLGEFGEVYVLDWGVARVRDAHDDIPTPLAREDIQTLDETKTGAMLGTPGFIAPESMRGQIASPAADVYALGAILFEILAGEALHPRGEAAIASTLAKPQASPMQRRGGDKVPPELDMLCMAALAEDPTARPTAHELAEGVQGYLDGDRDFEARRRLAAQQLASARDALATDGPDSRATAMRRAGRALALDPESKDAAGLVGSLLLEPPSPMPPALVADIEAHERALSQHRSWRAVWAYLSIVALAPLLLLVDVKNWPLIGAFYGVVGLAVFNALYAARVGRPLVVAILIVNLALAVLFTRLTGPFILTPLAISCILVGMASIRKINAHLSIMIVWTLVAVLLPIVLEWAGVMPRTWEIGHKMTAIVSTVIDTHGTRSEAGALVFANLVFTLVVALIAYAFSKKRQESQRALFVREWHLRHLIPPGAERGAPKWATKLGQRVISK